VNFTQQVLPFSKGNAREILNEMAIVPLYLPHRGSFTEGTLKNGQ